MKLIKKLLLSALALVCTVTAFASCGGQNNDNNDDNNNGGSNVVTTIEKDLSEIAETVMSNSGFGEESGFMVIKNTDEYFDLESATGLTDKTLVKEVVVYEPMMTSRAISFVFVRVAEGTKAVDVAKEMYEKINRSKWICVTADKDAVAASVDLVCFAMVQDSLGVDLNKIVEDFKSECGGKLDYQK